MYKDNPFTITFGKQPGRLISRYEDIDEITSTFDSDNPVSQTYIIEGVRGSGKTVLMTTVAKVLAEGKDWIIINLNPAMDLLSNFAIRLKDACNNKPELLKKGFSISAAGFGVGINGDGNDTDHVGIIERAFKDLMKAGKKVLITIDEVVNDKNMRVFASQFQIFVRQDYPIFLIMTGLYENIYEIQNDPGLTFLLRSPKIITGPLSILQIKNQYRNIFETDDDSAQALANLTKGYAFAFQALGVSYWNNRSKGMDAVLEQYDELLDDFVYKKIWDTLSAKDREILRAIEEETVKTADICSRAGISNSSFAKYRDKLILKGLIWSPQYGYTSLTLPRFHEVVSNYNI